MKTKLLYFGLVLGLTVLGGCAGTAEKKVPREVQLGPEFQPRKVYALEMKQAWDVTLNALKKEGIPLEMANRDIWVMRTDYQKLSSWERQKCDLRFSQEPQRNTYIFVSCLYEAKSNAGEPFRDFTYSAPRKTMKAEEEMYRRIEPHLLSFERTTPFKEEVSEKATVRHSPSKLPEKPISEAETARPGTAPAEAAPLVAAERQTAAGIPPSGQAGAADKPRPAAEGGPPSEAKERAAMQTTAVLPKSTEIKEETLSSSQAAGAPPAALTQPASPQKPEQVRQTAVAKEGAPIRKGVEGPSKIILLTREVTKMWAEPTSKSKVVLVLKKGRKVEKLAEFGEFTKVRLSWGDSGWVLTRFLQPVP
ncbi:MAG: hypothetical protein HXY45_23170 [Syntrophaceae bacterium]|nr:hypothetical protein [Syntrophaceae bacterium]